MSTSILAVFLAAATLACEAEPQAPASAGNPAGADADARLDQGPGGADARPPGADAAPTRDQAAPPDGTAPRDGAAADAGLEPADRGPPDPAAGAALYNEFCAFCHGLNGEGYVSDNANALAHPAFLATATDDFLRQAIVHGRPGTPMPILGAVNGGPLSDADVDLIVDHLRGWQQTEPLDVHGEVVEGDPARGAALYATHCVDCHGVEGKGGEYQSVANPWFLETASDGFIAHALRYGRGGTPMEAWLDTAGGPLTATEINDLVALIRSWQVPVEGPVNLDYVPDPENAAINPGGPQPQFTRRDDRYIPAAEIHAALQAGQTVILLDARARAEFLQMHITGALSIPHFELADYLDRLPRDVWIIAYCGCPHAISNRAYDTLAAAGFDKIGVLDEGLWHWRDQGWPTAAWPE